MSWCVEQVFIENKANSFARHFKGVVVLGLDPLP